MRADLILAMPEEISVENTLFDFCSSFNVIEFKGQEDELNETEFIKNSVRVELLVLEEPSANFANTLNVFVSSRFPRQFLEYMKGQKCRFRRNKERHWEWWARVGLQNVLLIVCRDLPIEPRYYEWLIFAPADSTKWRDLVIALAREHNIEVLQQIYNMRPKEFEIMKPNVDKIIESDPENQAQYIKNVRRVFNVTNKKLVESLEPEEREELLQLLLEQKKQAEQKLQDN